MVYGAIAEVKGTKTIHVVVESMVLEVGIVVEEVTDQPVAPVVYPFA